MSGWVVQCHQGVSEDVCVCLHLVLCKSFREFLKTIAVEAIAGGGVVEEVEHFWLSV